MKKILIICLAAAMTSCGIYKNYSRPEIQTDGLYGTAETADSTTIGDISAGPGEQHRPAVGTVARQGGRGDAQVSPPGLSAVVQLRPAGFDQQFRQRPGIEDLFDSRYGQLADRHLRRSDQRQAPRQGTLSPEQGVRAGDQDAAHRVGGQPLLHAADARQPV